MVLTVLNDIILACLAALVVMAVLYLIMRAYYHQQIKRNWPRAARCYWWWK